MLGSSWKAIEKAADYRLERAKKNDKPVPKATVLSFARKYLKGKTNEDVNQITPIRMAMMLTTRAPRSEVGAMSVLTSWYKRHTAKSCKGQKHKSI